MAGILPRNAFLEETASLFTDEKIVTARSKIIDWLNEAALESTAKKCELLTKVQELLLHSGAELLDEFVDNVLAFGHDPVQDVRRIVVGFIEEVCKAKIEFLPKIINVLAMLVRDTSPQVQKRVIQACAAVYKNALKWLCSSEEISDSAEQAWNTLCLIKVQILDLIDNDNDGIRTNAIKFLEGIIIIQTYAVEDSMKRDGDFSLEDIPITLKIIRRRKLEDEANNIFDVLLQFHAASHISSVNLIACTSALSTIAKLRPSLMPPVLEAIKNLNSNLPPTLTDSQVTSVRKNMKTQLFSILKQPSSYEYQSIIIPILADIGATNHEISRAIPRLDKSEQQRRSKRAHDNATSQAAKKAKLEQLQAAGHESAEAKLAEKLASERQMEIDVDEVNEQKSKSNKANEAFILESLKSFEVVIKLVMQTMVNLPADPPSFFLQNYQPMTNVSIHNQLLKISQLLAEQMTEKRLGPGASCITKEPPMRPCITLEEEKIIIQSARKEIEIESLLPIKDAVTPMEIDADDKIDIDTKNEEATKKLRETLERVKNEQLTLPKMKQRIKTLKLQEVTKPLSNKVKEDFLKEAVLRILKCERQSIIGGVAIKRRKIITIMATIFSNNIRNLIMDYVMEDLKNRQDLIFNWLYEEYCLLQGYTKLTLIKKENKFDYQYNELLIKIIVNLIDHKDLKEKEFFLKKLFLEIPLLTDDAIKQLIIMCELEELSNCSMYIIKNLVIQRFSKRDSLLNILLKYTVHNNAVIRTNAIENIIQLYTVNKILNEHIEKFSIIWLEYLENQNPPECIFNGDLGRPDVTTVWSEDLAKICLGLFLAVLPYKEILVQKLCSVYINTTPDMKRTVLRNIDVAIKKIGTNSYELLNLIEKCPKNSETLIIRILYILTDKQQPPQKLIACVKNLYNNKINDIRLLIPVINYISKNDIITSLPKIIKLNTIILKDVINRLLGLGIDYKNINLPITSIDLMIQLHLIDIKKNDVKFIIKTITMCLNETNAYTQDIIIIILQQLIDLQPLPTLLMRTIIQTLTIYPRIASFIVNLLQRLISKKIWQEKVIWDGFLKCCQRLKAQSFNVLLQLPMQQLIDALVQCPDLKQPLHDHCKGLDEEQNNGNVTQQVMDILSGKTPIGPEKIENVVKIVTPQTTPSDNVEREKEPQETNAESNDEEILSEEKDDVEKALQPLPPGDD